MIQDSKHGLKTFRNNLFSGARFLALGNHVAYFQQVFDIASENGTPLYFRDVSRLDRQDDNAAARLFAAPTLEFLINHHPDQVGLAVYLFIFGEICDAYQNRSIPHLERVRMVLRARYFIDMWSTYIDTLPCYERSHYFISRECFDIISFLINGLISLIVVHRDHLPVFPLLFWLHSSEACEHIFGMARQLIKDFTMVDFIYMLPKLSVKIRETLLRCRSTHIAESKSRATGYNHTYLDHHNIDILNLSTFPDRESILEASQAAADEADSLILLLGITPSDLHSRRSLTTRLPFLQSWYPDEEFFQDLEYELDEDQDHEESGCETEEVLRLIAQTEDETFTRGWSSEDMNRAEVLSHAAIALTIDEQTQL